MSRARSIEHINSFDEILSVFDVINKIGQGITVIYQYMFRNVWDCFFSKTEV